jgi:glutamyl-tRNA reductase
MAEAVRQGEIARVARGDEPLSEAEHARLDAVTRAMLNKLLHEPTVRAREAAGSQDGLRHIDSLRYLFGLDLPDHPPAGDGSEAPQASSSRHLG